MRFRPTVPRQDPWGPGPARLRPGEPHDQHPAYAAPTEPSQTGSSDCQTIQNCLFSMFCHYKLTIYVPVNITATCIIFSGGQIH